MRVQRRRRKKMKFTGKIALVFLLLAMTIILVALISKNTETEKIHPDQLTAAQGMTVEFNPVKPFSGSVLNQSAVKQREVQKEKERQQKLKEQQKENQGDKPIYLTFDDGPSSSSEQLLDILKSYHAEATFFLIGSNMKIYPNAVKEMAADNIALGLHSMTHNAKKVYESKKAPLNEMNRAQQILEDITGVHATLIRLPYGSVPYLTNDMRVLLDKQAYKVWDWNVDSRDWEYGNEQYIQHTISEIEAMEQQNETPIVLLHDKPETVPYLPKLLNYLKKNGYQLKKITNDTVPLTFQCYDRCHSIN